MPSEGFAELTAAGRLIGVGQGWPDEPQAQRLSPASPNGNHQHTVATENFIRASADTTMGYPPPR